ncbi:hypothetical protein CN501_08255 [Bacillus cereus]|uniref:hypothetical protein n=1 Tax=Bacillus cereus TaxID=1396 RepID=UPI000BF8043C|nr:hypothetical protein [Bacillus cereus]PES17523.1 hypothetical protein CN501_08255 [Bacillus cereus]
MSTLTLDRNAVRNEVKRIKTENHLSKRVEKQHLAKATIGFISLIASMTTTVQIDVVNESKLIEYHIENVKKTITKYKETKGVSKMSTQNNSTDLNLDAIMRNLNSNPFYKQTNPILIKEVQIQGHLSSETSYIPLDFVRIKDAHLLQGTEGRE